VPLNSKVLVRSRFFFTRDFWSVPLSRSPLSVFAAVFASVKSAPFLLHLLHRFPLALKHSRSSGQPCFVAARIFLEARNARQIFCPVSVAVQASSQDFLLFLFLFFAQQLGSIGKMKFLSPIKFLSCFC
jgi:hypothetical protein